MVKVIESPIAADLFAIYLIIADIGDGSFVVKIGRSGIPYQRYAALLPEIAFPSIMRFSWVGSSSTICTSYTSVNARAVNGFDSLPPARTRCGAGYAVRSRRSLRARSSGAPSRKSRSTHGFKPRERKLTRANAESVLRGTCAHAILSMLPNRAADEARREAARAFLLATPARSLFPAITGRASGESACNLATSFV